jgi:hypothetical protein
MTRHHLPVVGAWLTTLSAFVFLFVFLIDQHAGARTPTGSRYVRALSLA